MARLSENARSVKNLIMMEVMGSGKRVFKANQDIFRKEMKMNESGMSSLGL